jgi:gamma-glutamylcyclotransferase (GGCT)/AIG2-like uncharacterized protein YtfP
MLNTTLFVYGTLKRGYWNHQRFCEGALSIKNATVRGRLYELPSGIPVLEVPPCDIIADGSGDIAHDLTIQEKIAEPAITLDHNSGWWAIRGELMTFADPVSRLQAIDSLEGFVPNTPCLYRRVLLPIYLQDGTAVAAWCYVLGMQNAHLRALNRPEWRGTL